MRFRIGLFAGLFGGLAGGVIMIPQMEPGKGGNPIVQPPDRPDLTILSLQL